MKEEKKLKIQIIGSGSMWTKFNSACYLIDDEIMIDFPNGACKYLYRLGINPINVNHILLTHFHGDHYFDVPFWLLPKIKKSDNNINIYCSKDGKKKIRQISRLSFPQSFKNTLNKINYCFKTNFSINDLQISKVLVNHGRMKPAFGYIINCKNVFVGFTGDTALCDSVLQMAHKCKYLFCDCMLDIGSKSHQGIDNLDYLSLEYPNCTFVVSHLEDTTREKLMKLNYPNVIVPSDGEIINIE